MAVNEMGTGKRPIISQVVACAAKELPSASFLINVQPLPAHSRSADYNSLIGSTFHDLRDDWSLASTHFVARLCVFY